MPVRTIRWSSAINTLMAIGSSLPDGEGHRDAGAVARLGRHGHVPPQQGGPLVHPHQAPSAALARPGTPFDVEPAAVVVDRERKRSVLAFEGDRDAGRPGVA